MLSFAQFGSDLDASTKAQIDHGAKLTELLKQPQYSPFTVSEQVLSLFAAKYGYLNTVKVEQVKEFESYMLKYFKTNAPEILDEIKNKGILDKVLTENIKSKMSECLNEFDKIYGEN